TKNPLRKTRNNVKNKDRPMFIYSILCKYGFIQVDTFPDNFISIALSQEMLNRNILLFKSFIILKKSDDLFHRMRRQVLKIINIINRHVIPGYGDDLIILFTIIHHVHHTYHICFNNRQRMYINGAKDENIQGILIIAIRLWNESIICGIIS